MPVGLDKTSGEIVLTIADAMEWEKAGEHMLALQTKINRYLDFIDAGELREHYADADSRSLRIDVVFRFAPPPAAKEFLTRAEKAIHEHGEAFSWRVYGASTWAESS